METAAGQPVAESFSWCPNLGTPRYTRHTASTSGGRGVTPLKASTWPARSARHRTEGTTTQPSPVSGGCGGRSTKAPRAPVPRTERPPPTASPPANLVPIGISVAIEASYATAVVTRPVRTTQCRVSSSSQANALRYTLPDLSREKFTCGVVSVAALRAPARRSNRHEPARSAPFEAPFAGTGNVFALEVGSHPSVVSLDLDGARSERTSLTGASRLHRRPRPSAAGEGEFHA